MDVDYAADVLEPAATTPPEEVPPVDYAGDVLATTKTVAQIPEGALSTAAVKAAQTGDTTEIEGIFSDVVRTSKGMGLAGARGLAGTLEGGTQVSLDLLAKTTGSESLREIANSFTTMTAEENKKFAENFHKEFGDSFSFNMANVAGGIAPFLIFKGGGVGTATQKALVARGMGAGKATVIGGGVSGAIGGAASGPIQFQEEPDLEKRLQNDLNNAVMGGVLGGGAGMALSSIPAVYNAFKETVYKTFDGARAQQIMRSARDIGITAMRLSDVTGSDLALGMERAAAATSEGRRAMEKVASDTRKQFLGFFGRTLKSFQNRTAKGGPLPARLESAFNRAEDDLVGARASNAAKNFSDAETAIVKQWEEWVKSLPPGQRVEELFPIADDPTFLTRLKARRVIPGKNYIGALDELEQRFSSAVPNKDTDAAVKHIRILRERFLNERQGHYSPRELQASLHQYGLNAKARTDSPGRGFSAETKRLIDTHIFGALKRDLDDAASRTDLPGAAKLKIARDQYAADSEPLDRLRGTALKSLFDGKIPPTIEGVRDAIVKMPTSQFKQTMKMIGRYDPTLHEKIGSDWLELAFQKAQRVSKAGEEVGRFPMDGTEFLKLADDKAKFNAIFKGADRVRINTAVKLLTRLNTVSEKANRPFMQMATQAARVAYSRDPTFASGLAVQLFAPKALSKIVRSDKGLAALSELSKPFNLERWAPAIVTLTNIAMSDQLQQPEQVQNMALMGK